MRHNVVALHPTPPGIGHYVHLGFSSHKILSALLVNGGLPIRRAVVDAAHANEQRELLVALKQHGVQLVMDTRSMELATPGGCTGSRGRLPWAAPEGYWNPVALGRPRALAEYCNKIAEFAVAQGVDVVLAPGHLHEKNVADWLGVDAHACELLRRALDSCGGQSIAIDLPFVAMSSVLEDAAQRRAFMSAASSLPFDNLWIRASGFGAQAGAARTHKLINAFGDIAASGKPIILDSAGGVPALAVAAFGVAGGIAHGIANMNEKFDSYPLRKPQARSGGGSVKWVYLPMIDKYVKAGDLDGYFALRGVKAQLICNDSRCCPHGASSMKANVKRHALHQRVRQLRSLEVVPEHQRPEHLLREEVRPAGRICRALERLPSVADSVNFHKMIRKQSHHLDDLEQMISRLALKRGELNRSREPKEHHSTVMPIASGY